MPRNRLSQFGASNRLVRIQPGATDGAQFGLNLFDEAGNVVTMESLLAALSGTPSSTDPSNGDIELDDVGVHGDGTVVVTGTLAQGDVRVSFNPAQAWMFG